MQSGGPGSPVSPARGSTWRELPSLTREHRGGKKYEIFFFDGVAYGSLRAATQRTERGGGHEFRRLEYRMIHPANPGAGQQAFGADLKIET
jgi:hypothetical protein